MDKNAFFREATLQICGNLDVENFLYNSFCCIQNRIPADAIYLTHHSRGSGKQVLLAMADSTGGSPLNAVMQLSEKARHFAQHHEKNVTIIDRAKEHPLALLWITRGLLEKDASLLILHLILGNTHIGAVTLMKKKPGTYSRKDADLFSLLSEPFAIALSNCIRFNELSHIKESLAEDNQFLRNELMQPGWDKIVGSDSGLAGVMQMVNLVAPLTSPVVLLGETGTGKEVIACAIHMRSPRKDKPFIKVNCGAIPEHLMDSELFGHEKGSFTGATSRKLGRFERASTGTIFLDEIGELRPEAQIRLLRVLQENEIERVGGNQTITVDIRVIAATHRNLSEMVEKGSFREDLFFRLNVFPVTIPPLRARREDISALVEYFIHQKCREMARRKVPRLLPGALEQLMAHSWPGNIRELQNIIERALILTRNDCLSFPDLKASGTYLPKTATDTHESFTGASKDGPEHFISLDNVITQHIRSAMDICGGKVEGKDGAADLLQINPSTLRVRMRKLAIPFGRKIKK